MLCKVQQSGLGVLGYLARNTQCRETITSSGGVELVHGAMRDHQRDPEMQRWGLHGRVQHGPGRFAGPGGT